MKALYFRHHELHQTDCASLQEGKTLIDSIADNGDGWGVGVYDADKKTLFLDGFENIIGADPSQVESRVLRDLKNAGIVPDKIESLN